MEPSRKIAIDLGFEPTWFSDEITFCGERNDAVIIITQFERDGISIIVAAQDEAEAEAIGSVFIEKIGVKSQQPLP